MSRKRKRWIWVGAVLLAAIVVGIFFGPVAGIALALGVLTVFLFGFDTSVDWKEDSGVAFGERSSSAPTPPSAGSTSRAPRSRGELEHDPLHTHGLDASDIELHPLDLA